jgi:hypothetical protein
MNFEEILNRRREAVIKSIRPINTVEVVALGESLFPFHDNPWREQFFGFLTEHPNATFYHADLPDGAKLLYCHTHKRGIWFIPGSGVGIIQEKGLDMLSEIVSTGAERGG